MSKSNDWQKEENHNRNFKGVWIDRSIWLNKELTCVEKCIIAEIDSLSGGEDGEGCKATNRWFAKHFQMTAGSVSNSIAKLRQAGWVKSTIKDGGQRRMIIQNPPIPPEGTHPSRNGGGGIHPEMEGYPSRNGGGVHPEMEGGSRPIYTVENNTRTQLDNLAAKPPSPHHFLIALWSERFEAKHGFKYTVLGAKDGAAAKRLLGSGIPPEELVAVAELAWNRTDWDSKQAATIAGFSSRFNQIRVAVASPKPVVASNMPLWKKIVILEDDLSNHLSNRNRISYDGDSDTPESQKDYATKKEKLKELKALQAQEACR